MARGRADGPAPALQAGDALLQHRDGRVAQARIDIAVALQVEERGGVVDILENIGGGLVDRGRARTGGGVGGGSGMNGKGLEAVRALGGHGKVSLREGSDALVAARRDDT